MKKLLIVIIVFTCSISGYSQRSLSLEEAIDQALANKPSMGMARLDGTIAREQLDESRRKFAPEIRGEVTLQYNPIIPTSIIPIGQFNAINPTDETRPVQFGQPWSNSAGLRGKQVLYSPSLQGELTDRKLEAAKAELNTLSETEKIKYDVSRSYYNLLLALEEMKFAVADTVRAYDLYQLASRRYEQQQARKIDKDQAAYDLLNTRYLFQKLRAAVDNARLQLLFNTGLPENTQVQLTSGLSSNGTGQLTSPDSTMLASRSDYRKALIDRQIYLGRIGSERRTLLPEVTVNAFIGANQFTRSFSLAESNTWFGNAFINLNASVPISAFYVQSKKVQQARSRYERSELALAEVRRSFEYETRVAVNNYQTALNDYINQSESLNLSRQLYEDAVNRFREGQSLSTTVQTSLADVQKAQYRALKAMYDVVVARLELDRLTGFSYAGK